MLGQQCAASVSANTSSTRTLRMRHRQVAAYLSIYYISGRDAFFFACALLLSVLSVPAPAPRARRPRAPRRAGGPAAGAAPANDAPTPIAHRIAFI